jgi:hypothetical protein
MGNIRHNYVISCIFIQPPQPSTHCNGSCFKKLNIRDSCPMGNLLMWDWPRFGGWRGQQLVWRLVREEWWSLPQPRHSWQHIDFGQCVRGQRTCLKLLNITYWTVLSDYVWLPRSNIRYCRSGKRRLMRWICVVNIIYLFINLCICDLVNGAISSSDYVSSTEKMNNK